jgi:tRNA threonylcarbamoyladenosine biosynthesis protein TsaB
VKNKAVYILCIETANAVTSVSIAENENCLYTKDILEPNRAADVLHVLIEQLLAETNLSFADIDAVAVSGGPGSYTGLRIATATAKGYCFALDIPLIAVSTLMAMTHGIQTRYQQTNFDVFVPMIDARRLEVFTAFYSKDLTALNSFPCLIIDEQILNLFHTGKKYLLFGNGAEKANPILKTENISINRDFVPSSIDLCFPAFSAFNSKNFEELAYFEPDYTKPFYTTATGK